MIHVLHVNLLVKCAVEIFLNDMRLFDWKTIQSSRMPIEHLLFPKRSSCITFCFSSFDWSQLEAVYPAKRTPPKTLPHPKAHLAQVKLTKHQSLNDLEGEEVYSERIPWPILEELIEQETHGWLDGLSISKSIPLCNKQDWLGLDEAESLTDKHFCEAKKFIEGFQEEIELQIRQDYPNFDFFFKRQTKKDFWLRELYSEDIKEGLSPLLFCLQETKSRSRFSEISYTPCFQEKVWEIHQGWKEPLLSCDDLSLRIFVSKINGAWEIVL